MRASSDGNDTCSAAASSSPAPRDNTNALRTASPALAGLPWCHTNRSIVRVGWVCDGVSEKSRDGLKAVYLADGGSDERGDGRCQSIRYHHEDEIEDCGTRVHRRQTAACPTIVRWLASQHPTLLLSMGFGGV